MRGRVMRWGASSVFAACLLAVAVHGFMPVRAWADDDEDDEGKTHIQLDYTLRPDLTYDEWVKVDSQPVKPGKPARNTSRFRDFSPATETLTVAEAWVTDPDGSRHDVPPEDIFTRSAPQPANAPGFNAQQRITVVFPRVGPEARVHILWRAGHKVPQMFGFNLLEGAFGPGKLDDMTVTLHVPPGVPLKWYADPAVATTDKVENGSRVITASFQKIPALKLGYPTVDYREFRPRFMATTLDSLVDYGNRIDRASQSPMDDATRAKIKALADKITGDKTGLEAAAAIHDWIRQNIAYVAVYLNPNDGWVEHPVGKILENGFGDCKDQVALMTALLSAKGIRAERAVVDWGNLFTPFPLPVAWQFNHVIAYLPDFDTFDNPTDKTAAFGVFDKGLAGKQAVLIQNDSKIVHVPAATPTDVWNKNHSVLKLSPDGNIEGTAAMVLSPNDAKNYQTAIKNRGNDNYLSTILALNNQEGDGKLRVLEPKTWHDPLQLKAHWATQNAIEMSDPEIVLPLESGFDPERLTQLAFRIRNDVRVAPLEFAVANLEWQFEVELPAGISIKHLPMPVHITNKSGHFDSEVTVNGAQIIVKRSFVSNKTVYSPQDYPDLRELLVAAVKAGHSYAILQRQKLGG